MTTETRQYPHITKRDRQKPNQIRVNRGKFSHRVHLRMLLSAKKVVEVICKT